MGDPYHPFKSEKAKEAYLAYYDEHAQRWPIPSDPRLVATSFGDTFVRVGGPGDATPLVLLPGDSENSLAWIPVIEALSVSHRTYALDHIYDIGRSVYSRAMRHPDDFVRWLDELFIALELDDLDLMGHSYGGWQAGLYALAHPERLRSLVLLAPASTVLRPRLGLLVRAMLYYFIPARSVAKRYLYWYAPVSVRSGDTRALIDAMVDEQQLARRCFKRRNWVRPTVFTDADWQGLRVPTLFLVGENEVTYPARGAVRHLGMVAPHVRTLLSPDADHHLAICKPRWVIDGVLEFLAEG